MPIHSPTTRRFNANCWEAGIELCFFFMTCHCVVQYLSDVLRHTSILYYLYIIAIRRQDSYVDVEYDFVTPSDVTAKTS